MRAFRRIRAVVVCGAKRIVSKRIKDQGMGGAERVRSGAKDSERTDQVNVRGAQLPAGGWDWVEALLATAVSRPRFSFERETYTSSVLLQQCYRACNSPGTTAKRIKLLHCARACIVCTVP